MKKVKKMAVGGIPKSPVMPPKGGPVRPTPTPPPRPVSPPPTLPPRPLVLPPRPSVNKSNNPSLPYLVDTKPAPSGPIASPGLATFPELIGRPSGGLQPPVVVPGVGDTFKSSGTSPSFKQALSAAGFKTGMKKGGKVPSASKRADGIATKGKTRGKIV